MKPISNYVSEKLFTDIDSQMDKANDIIIKKKICDIFYLDPNVVTIENKIIKIDNMKFLSIYFKNNKIIELFDFINTAGYKFGYIRYVEFIIYDEDHLNYFNNIESFICFLNFRESMSLHKDFYINIVDKPGSFFKIIIEKDLKINEKIKINGKVNTIDINFNYKTDFNKIDNLLYNIVINDNPMYLNIGQIYIPSKVKITNYLNDLINNSKFIKKIIPEKVFEFKIIQDNRLSIIYYTYKKDPINGNLKLKEKS